MRTIVCIVEGQGEVEALRILIEKKLIDWKRQQVTIASLKNVHGRHNLTKDGGLELFLERARREVCNGVLVLLDADKDCAARLARELAARARRLRLPFPVAVVCAKCEFEAWFLASLETIAGHVGIPAGIRFQGDVENKRGAKEWLSDQMPEGRIYKETQDQASMTHWLDPELVRAQSRSFRRLEHAILELLEEGNRVTPE
jgi:hypothetical protein